MTNDREFVKLGKNRLTKIEKYCIINPSMIGSKKLADVETVIQSDLRTLTVLDRPWNISYCYCIQTVNWVDIKKNWSKIFMDFNCYVSMFCIKFRRQ